MSRKHCGVRIVSEAPRKCTATGCGGEVAAVAERSLSPSIETRRCLKCGRLNGYWGNEPNREAVKR